MYYNARYYIPGLGKFASADTLVPDPANPQSWNRYSYANNRPLSFTDFTGRWLESAWDAFNVGLGIASFVDNVSQGNYGWAAVDAMGVVVDAAALVTPIVPGGGGSIIKGARAADTVIEVAQAANRVDNVVDAVQSVSRIDGVAGATGDMASMYAARYVDDVANQVDNVAGSLQNTLPEIIYHEGKTNPGNLIPRASDEGMVSFRDSLSNPWPLQEGQRPVFRPGEPYFGVDTTKLPSVTVHPDNIPPGHVSVEPNVSADMIKNAIVVRGVFPR